MVNSSFEQNDLLVILVLYEFWYYSFNLIHLYLSFYSSVHMHVVRCIYLVFCIAHDPLLLTVKFPHLNFGFRGFLMPDAESFLSSRTPDYRFSDMALVR